MFKPVNERLWLDGSEIVSVRQLVDIYGKRAKEEGLCGRAMFYRTEEQYQRKILQFAALVRRLVRPFDSLLDVGCGFGSLAEVVPECAYLGIDLVPEFVEEAKRRNPGREFRVCAVQDWQGVYDWCVLLGVVNGIPDPAETVEAAWARCRAGVIVDFVDERRLPETFADLNRFDIGQCVGGFLDLGARLVEVHPTTSSWSIIVARREGVIA